MKLVRRAAILAIEKKGDCLDLELLAESYEERLSSRMPGGGNPFSDSFESLKINPLSPVTGSAKKTN